MNTTMETVGNAQGAANTAKSKRVIAQNSAAAEKILNNPVARKELTEAEILLNQKKEELKALEAEARKAKEAIMAELKAKQAELKAQREAEKVLKAEIKAKEKAERDAKKALKAEKAEVFTRAEAVGIVMRENPEMERDAVIKVSDDLYVARSGKKSNLKESLWAYNNAKKFLKGWNAAE